MINDPHFFTCLPFTLKEEGGKSNNRHDPGGRTNLGIIQREYDAWRRSQGEGTKDVYTISTVEMQEIYHSQYWLPHCPQLKPGLDLCYFDLAVNGGAVQAVKILQRSLGITADGHFGLVTADRVANVGDIAGLVRTYCNNRAGFYRSLHRLFAYFGKDWLGRTARIEKAALAMVEK